MFWTARPFNKNWSRNLKLVSCLTFSYFLIFFNDYSCFIIMQLNVVPIFDLSDEERKQPYYVGFPDAEGCCWWYYQSADRIIFRWNHVVQFSSGHGTAGKGRSAWIESSSSACIESSLSACIDSFSACVDSSSSACMKSSSWADGACWGERSRTLR